MKAKILVTTCAALVGAFVLSSAQAQTPQQRMKECATEWSGLKAAKQTAGKTYRDFQKECLAKSASAQPPAGQTATPAATTPPAAPPAPRSSRPRRRRPPRKRWPQDNTSPKLRQKATARPTPWCGSISIRRSFTTAETSRTARPRAAPICARKRPRAPVSAPRRPKRRRREQRSCPANQTGCHSTRSCASISRSLRSFPAHGRRRRCRR